MLRLVHGPFAAIERELLEALSGKPKFEPAFVAAPSARLARHLKEAAARRFPEGLFGASFLPLYYLAVGMSRDPRPLVRDPIWFERLVVNLLRRHYAGAPFLGRAQPTYDLAAALLGALRDLKDARVPPDPADAMDHLRRMVDDKATELNTYDITKINDVMCLYRHYDQELRRLGVMDGSDVWDAASRGAPPAGRIYVYGFYDMTQVQWEFVKSLRADVTFLSPYEEGRMRFAEPFLKSFVIPAADEVRAATAPTPSPKRVVFNAAGERDEVWGVAKQILRMGVPFDQIGVVARTMEPYLPHIEAIFGENAIRWTPPRGRPVSDDPMIKFLRGLFRVGLDDYPRGATLDVLRSPFYEGPEDRRGWVEQTADRRISRGRDLWRSRLAPGPLRDAFERLVTMEPPSRATWKQFASAYQGPPEVLARLASLPEEEIPRAEFQEAFERELDRLTAPAERTGGVSVTDVMGARGLNFRVLFVMGLNSHSFPRFILEEPFLSDRARRDLFEIRAHKISIRHEGYDEERLLFHLMERAATETLMLFTQRSDAEGRKKDPSPFLGQETGTSIPRSLRARLATLDPELMTRSELLLAAHDVEGCLRTFGRDADRYRRARAVIKALEGDTLTAYEGLVGGLKPPAETSATRLETYADCPFKYFARHVLKLAPRDDPERAEDLTAAEIGLLEHKILELHYKHEMPVARAAERAFAEFDVPALDPALREARKRVMTRRLAAFAPKDEWVPSEFEVDVRGTVAGLHFKGRIDRIDRAGDRVRVVDYKHRLNDDFKTHLDTLAKTGRKFQAPLYLKMARADEACFFFLEGGETRTLSADFWKEHGKEFEKVLRGLAGGIAAGRFPVAPSRECLWCDYRTMCRRTYGPTRRKL